MRGEAQGSTLAASPSIAELATRLRDGHITAVTLVERCLEAIARREPELNAFISVLDDDARAAARRADRDIAAGTYRGPLHGIPISVKDLIDLQALPTTAASRVRAGHRAIADAPVIARLREAGAIFIGKCNLHEFAFGTTGEDSAYGPTRHPLAADRGPGGSSSGSAVSVATGMALASVATDTGGSIRIPAAASGVTGLKPTFGEVPCDGVVPLAPSLDHVGPIGRTVEDVWLLYGVMVGRPPSSRLGRTKRGSDIRLGLPRRYFLELLDPEVGASFDATVARLRAAGCQIDDVDIPHANTIATVYLHTVLAEASSVHRRTLEERPEDYTPAVRRRLVTAGEVSAEDYARAQERRETLRTEVDAVLNGRSALLLPTLPIPAPLLGQSSVSVGGITQDVRAVTLRLTQLFDLTGHPAITVPCGTTLSGLPCGAQLVGERGQTLDLLELAATYEPELSPTLPRSSS